MKKTVTLASPIKMIVRGKPGPPGATGATGATGPAGPVQLTDDELAAVNGANTPDVNNVFQTRKENETTHDATGGGTVTIDVRVGNVHIITTDDTAFTVEFSKLPAAGDSQGLTIYLIFTAALPTITWPTLGPAANPQVPPDLSDATITDGWAVVTAAEIQGDTYVWKVSAQ